MLLFGKGATLSWNGANVGGLKSIGMPEVSIDTEEVTTHTLTTRWKEWAAKLIDAGEIPVSGYFDAADITGQQAMYADALTGTVRPVVITGPNSSFSWSLTALVTKIKLIGDAPVDGNLEFAASIKVTGAPSLGIATSTGMSTVAFSNSGVLAPAFAIGTLQYAVTFLTGVASFTLTPTAASHTITVTANGASQTVTSGQASSAIALGAAGSVTEVVVTVVEANKAAKTYKFLAVRA